MEEKTSAEIDLKSILALFVNSWPTFLIVVVGFLLFSVYQISKATPKFIAEIIFETKETTQRNQSIRLPGLSELNALIPESMSRAETNIVPKIIGREFLINYIKEYDLKKRLSYRFAPSKVSIFSLAGLLEFFSLYKTNLPTEEQSEEHFIASIRSMIDVNNFRHNNVDTPAFRLQVKHENAEFAAFMANTLVEYYFKLDQAEKKINFEETINYLAGVQSKSQLEVEEIKKQIDAFIIKNSYYLGNNVFEDEDMKLDFGAQLRKYTQLDMRKRSIYETIEFLSQTRSRRELREADFGSQGQISSNYSNNFIGEVRKLQQSENPDVEEDLIRIVDKEIERLKALVNMLSRRIDDEKSLAKEFLRLEDEYTSLRLKYLVKKNFSEGLQFTIQERALQTTSFNINNNIVHSIATPPTNPSEPNIKKIFIINLLVALFISSFIILLNQLLRQNIYNTRQIATIHPFQNSASVSLRQLLVKGNRQFSEGAQKGLSISFIDSLGRVGKTLCVVEIGKKKFFQHYLADRVASFLSFLMAQKSGKKIAVIDNQPTLNESHIYKDNLKKSFGAEDSYKNVNPVSIINLSDKSSLSEKANFFPLSNDLKDFDHVLIPLGKNIPEVTKYNTILESTNYLLVGFKGNFTKQDVKNFLTSTTSETQNCVGFILID